MNSGRDQSQTSSHKRSKNWFSDASHDVVENIISFLTIKEATKLSTLSNRFRHSWKFCQNLCFDRSVFESMSRQQFITLINNFFQDRLTTKAVKFSLYFDPTNEFQQLNEWIHQAIASGITELDLDLSPTPANNERFLINHDLIGRALRRLKIVNCEIQFPLALNSVNGYLPHLGELTLKDTSISQTSLGWVMVNCPRLTSLEMVRCFFGTFRITISARGLKSFQKLVVTKCSDIGSITIDAPLLNSFHYHGKMTEFVFRGRVLSRLSDAIFDINPSRGFMFLPRRRDVMIGIAFVQVLSLSSTFLEGFSTRFEENVDQLGLRIWLLRLKELNLHVSTESFITPKDIVEFLKKCREIEKLKIVLANNSLKNSIYWDVHGRSYMNETTLNLTHLKTIKITGFTYNELPVTMTRFFLMNVQQLEDLILVKGKNDNFPEEFTPNQLRQGLPSLSPAVTIDVIEYRRDTNGE